MVAGRKRARFQFQSTARRKSLCALQLEREARTTLSLSLPPLQASVMSHTSSAQESTASRNSSKKQRKDASTQTSPAPVTAGRHQPGKLKPSLNKAPYKIAFKAEFNAHLRAQKQPYEAQLETVQRIFEGQGGARGFTEFRASILDVIDQAIAAAETQSSEDSASSAKLNDQVRQQIILKVKALLLPFEISTLATISTWTQMQGYQQIFDELDAMERLAAAQYRQLEPVHRRIEHMERHVALRERRLRRLPLPWWWLPCSPSFKALITLR